MPGMEAILSDIHSSKEQSFTTGFIAAEFRASAQLLQQLASESADQLLAVGEMLMACLQSGHKVLIFGNGGSAADAQHFATELGGRYRQERRALPALALTTDTSMLTAVSNDYGFAQVFARQVEALAQPGDVAIGISTSGRSANVIAGMQTARTLGARTVALLGANITGLAGLADQVISVPSTDTPRIQEAHTVIIHILCDLVEKSLLADRKGADVQFSSSSIALPGGSTNRETADD
jgi:D-sedoheptulose 7-phosphate isomerase